MTWQILVRGFTLNQSQPLTGYSPFQTQMERIRILPCEPSTSDMMEKWMRTKMSLKVDEPSTGDMRHENEFESG